MSESEKQPIFGAPSVGDNTSSGGGESSQSPVYYGTNESPRAKWILRCFVGVIVINVLICLILCIVQGVQTRSDGFLYFLMALCLAGLVLAQIILIRLVRKGDLAQEKSWFLYFLGFCILLEAVFTDVVIMN